MLKKCRKLIGLGLKKCLKSVRFENVMLKDVRARRENIRLKSMRARLRNIKLKSVRTRLGKSGA